MRHPTLGRAGILGVALSLAVTAIAFADTVVSDADTDTLGIQTSRDLGDAAPGEVKNVSIDFTLTCGNGSHVDPEQSVLVDIDSSIVPVGGSAVMDQVVLGPVLPDSWPADGDECTGDEEPLEATGTIVVTAPPAAGPHEYSLRFARTPSPAGLDDGNALSGVTVATFYLNVVEPVNTPPALVLPADMTVAADTPEGWTADYVVSAIDAEDEPDPTPTCVPAVGEVLPLGDTIVECSVTDSDDLTTTGSFVVTVEAPVAEPEPEPDVTPTAVFGPPVKADGLDGRAGRTIPLKVRLKAGDVSVGEGSLVVVVTSCEGGDPVAELEMDWREGSDRWFGLLRTRGLEAGCYDVRAIHDGVDVGGFELRLFDKRSEVAKEKSAAAREKAASVKEKVNGAAAKSIGARQNGNAKGGR